MRKIRAWSALSLLLVTVTAGAQTAESSLQQIVAD